MIQGVIDPPQKPMTLTRTDHLIDPLHWSFWSIIQSARNTHGSFRGDIIPRLVIMGAFHASFMVSFIRQFRAQGHTCCELCAGIRHDEKNTDVHVCLGTRPWKVHTTRNIVPLIFNTRYWTSFTIKTNSDVLFCFLWPVCCRWCRPQAIYSWIILGRSRSWMCKAVVSRSLALESTAQCYGHLPRNKNPIHPLHQ